MPYANDSGVSRAAAGAAGVAAAPAAEAAWAAPAPAVPGMEKERGTRRGCGGLHTSKLTLHYRCTALGSSLVIPVSVLGFRFVFWGGVLGVRCLELSQKSPLVGLCAKPPRMANFGAAERELLARLLLAAATRQGQATPPAGDVPLGGRARSRRRPRNDSDDPDELLAEVLRRPEAERLRAVAPPDDGPGGSSSLVQASVTGAIGGFAAGFALKRGARVALLVAGGTILYVAAQRVLATARAPAPRPPAAGVAAAPAAAADEDPAEGDAAPRAPPDLSLQHLLGLSPAWGARLSAWGDALHRAADADGDGVVSAGDAATHAQALITAVSTLPGALFAGAFLYGLKRG